MDLCELQIILSGVCALLRGGLLFLLQTCILVVGLRGMLRPVNQNGKRKTFSLFYSNKRDPMKDAVMASGPWLGSAVTAPNSLL